MKIATSKKPMKASKKTDVKENSKPEKTVKKFDDDDDEDEEIDTEPKVEEFNESLGFDDDDDDDY